MSSLEQIPWRSLASSGLGGPEWPSPCPIEVVMGASFFSDSFKQSAPNLFLLFEVTRGRRLAPGFRQRRLWSVRRP